QNITEALTISYQVLQEGEPSALEMVGKAMDEMRDVADVDQTLEEISETLSNSFYQLQELASEIFNELDRQEYDENRLNDIASRLNLIQQLKRSEEHTSELQSRFDLVCRLLLEKNKT